MKNKTYQQFVTNIWLVLPLAVILLTGCLPIKTSLTPVSVVATPANVTTVAFSPPGAPILGQTVTPTSPQTIANPAPTTLPTPDSFTREGDTLSSSSPLPLPTPVAPSATFMVSCVVGPDALQLRGGPGSGFDSFKTLPGGTEVSALKYYNTSASRRDSVGDNANGLWLLVETKQREAGWVNAGDVSCQGDLLLLPIAEGIGPLLPTALPPATTLPPTALSAVTVAVPPTPTLMPSPTLPAPPLNSWRGEYYSNPDLAGKPALVRNDPTLDLNWGSGSPEPNVPADNFSARWTRPFEFTEEGDYRFWADVDDGVKLYLDGWLVIDEWNTNPYILHMGVFSDIKPGIHTLTVEYFEAAGDAHIKVWFEKTIVSTDKWVGEYYNNPDFRDAPFLVRKDDDIDFYWDDDEPASGMNDDNFSVRWQRTIAFKEGDYDFQVQLAEKDRVKVYLDNWLIIEEDSEHGGTVTGSFEDVKAGYHTIRVEYQDYSDEAGIEVDWDKDD